MARESIGWRLARALDLVGGQGNPSEGSGKPIRNGPSPLTVFLPFIRERNLRRKRREAREDHYPTSTSAVQLTLEPLGGWHVAGLKAGIGDCLRVSAKGQIFLNRALEVSVGPRAVLWYRFGDGPIKRMTRDNQCVVADHEGELKFQINLPGSFGSVLGELSDECPPPPMTGTMMVNVERVDTDHESPELLASPPDGWKYFSRLGNADIFHHCDREQAICCQTQGDVGILQFAVDAELTHDLKLDWEWLVEELPSQLPEHVQPTHDYLSLGVEFDNGLDLTYMWSACLGKDTIFQCPLPWWDLRETHWVLRTPEDGLERWHAESRTLVDDYKEAIGGPTPQRVVRVWLIANSAFQGGRGACRYRKIALRSKDSETTIQQ